MLTFNHKVIKIGSGRVWISNTYIPPMTLRCVFTQAPSSNTNWTVRAVDEDNLIYDVTRTNVQWNRTFLSNVVEVIGQGDCSTVTATQGLFASNTTLTSVCNLSFPASTSFINLFSGCTSLKAVPLFNISSARNTSRMFYGCTAVESGALALYTQASTQTTPPKTHTDMFTNCGSETTTGAAELARIPASWGGLG